MKVIEIKDKESKRINGVKASFSKILTFVNLAIIKSRNSPINDKSKSTEIDLKGLYRTIFYRSKRDSN